MRKLITITTVLILSGTICLPSIALANPCRSIASACMDLGYYRGGDKVGKGLIINCVLPVAQKKKRLPGQSFSESTLRECRNLVMEKMRQQ